MPPGLRRALRRVANLALDLKDRGRAEPRTIVWILAHVRSGSTLLMHLLSSHPEILGAGERNAVYESAGDLRKLEVDSFFLRRQLFNDFDFVVDQMNHDHLLPHDSLLDHPRVKKIFLIREPRASIASSVRVLGKHYGTTRQQAVTLYLGRLRTLARYAQLSTDSTSQAFLSYEALVQNPPGVLERLRTWLGVTARIEETYRTFDFTGSRGDPSDRIRSGRIRDDLPPRQIDLEPELADRLQARYDEVRALLRARCTDLQPATARQRPTSSL